MDSRREGDRRGRSMPPRRVSAADLPQALAERDTAVDLGAAAERWALQLDTVERAIDAADRRDLAAASRDRAARDRDLAATAGDRDATDLEELRRAAAKDREAASNDRYWAALDRDEAAGDRALLREQSRSGDRAASVTRRGFSPLRRLRREGRP
jgi:hypothetical protein